MFGRFVDLARKVDRAFQLVENHARSIDRLSEQLTELTERVVRLETREQVLIAEAKGASAAAATAASTMVMADLARRIGVLEERSRRRALPRPG